VELKSPNFLLNHLLIDRFIAEIVGQKEELRDLEDNLIAPHHQTWWWGVCDIMKSVKMYPSYLNLSKKELNFRIGLKEKRD